MSVTAVQGVRRVEGVEVKCVKRRQRLISKS